MAAPAFRSLAGDMYYSSTPALAKPTGVVEGDWLFALLVNTDYTRTLDTLPSGWDLDYDLEHVGLTSNAWVASKQAGASEPSTYSFGFNADFNGAALIIAASGGDAVDAKSSAGPTNGTSSPFAATAGGVTTTGADRLLIYLSAARWTAIGSNPSLSVPSGFTSRGMIGYDWDAMAVGAATAEQASAGASGDKAGSWTLSSASQANTFNFLFAIAPPVSGPTLSLAGVQDITATSARPKVTLTF
jgi:hypothetical protein